MELVTSLLCLALASQQDICPDYRMKSSRAAEVQVASAPVGGSSIAGIPAADAKTAEPQPVADTQTAEPSVADAAAAEVPSAESPIAADSAPVGTEASPFDVAAGSAAVESEPMKPQLTTTVYVDTRLPFQHARGNSLSPALAPAVSNLSEGNVQLKATLTPSTFASGDTSLYWQWAPLYKDGQAVDSTQYRPQVIVNELYLSSGLNEHLNVTVGKKRVVWGPGMAFNPMDFLNPPKDPSNPTAQRAGAWLGRVELPYDNFSLTLVGAAKVLRQYSGLPTALVYNPDYPTAEQVANGTAVDNTDHQAHFAVAARAYALVADTDVNVVYGLTNEYNDAFQHKGRLGFSLSRTFGAWELHTENLLQTGYSRIWPDADCAQSPEAFGRCVVSQTAVAPRSKLDSTAFTPKALLGARYQFEDNAIFSAEYFFNGEGLDSKGYADYVRLLSYGIPLAASNAQIAANLQAQLAGGAADPGAPQRFQFDPLRRHYLFLSYSRPQLWNDFTLGASVMASLSDFSGQVSPFVTWSAREWLEFNATAYLGVPSIGKQGVEVDGHRYGEFSLGASDASLQVSARAFF